MGLEPLSSNQFCFAATPAISLFSRLGFSPGPTRLAVRRGCGSSHHQNTSAGRRPDPVSPRNTGRPSNRNLLGEAFRHLPFFSGQAHQIGHFAVELLQFEWLLNDLITSSSNKILRVWVARIARNEDHLVG